MKKITLSIIALAISILSMAQKTVDAASIPGQGELAKESAIALTGEWNTTKLGSLYNALHEKSGFATLPNEALQTVDMSQATFAADTRFVSNSMGTFQNCKALESVVWPADKSNITRINQIFNGCTALKVADFSGMTLNSNGIANPILNSGVEKVILPASIPATGTLCKCDNIKTIDWSAFDMETIPTCTLSSFVGYLTYSEITLIVPESKVESFKGLESTWGKFNVVGGQVTGINATTSAVKPVATKVIKNGKVVIYSNDKEYSVNGALLK